MKPHNQLVVADPDGKIIHTYNKIWSDDRFTEAPGLFSVDGVLCCGTTCADRWVRSVEVLPAMAGAKIIIECSSLSSDKSQHVSWTIIRINRSKSADCSAGTCFAKEARRVNAIHHA